MRGDEDDEVREVLGVRREMGRWWRASQAVVCFEQWSGHDPSCLLTGLVLLPWG